MKQLFQDLLGDEKATDSESPFDIILCLNEVLSSDMVSDNTDNETKCNICNI